MQKMPRVNHLLDNWKSHRVSFFLFFSVLVIDQLSKFWIRENFFLGQSRPEDGFLRLTFVANEGGVFGFPINRWLSLIFASIVIIVALSIYFHFKTSLSRSKLMKTAFALVIGGSIGNLIDRIHLGYVTDFIDVKLWNNFHWPVFNVADIAIIFGVILTMLFLLQLARGPERI